MKNKIQIIGLLVLMLTLFAGNTYAGDKDFQGIIIYNISYENSDIDPQMMAMMPKTMKMKIKGDKSRTEISMGMGSTSVIFNGTAKEGFTLMDMMGQKLAFTMTSDDIEKELSEGPDMEIDVTGETKEIAGIVCKKVIVKIHEEGEKEMKYIVFFTEELGSGMLNYNNPMFKDIDGVMLEYSMNENNMSMTFTAISVDKKKISDDEFDMPDDYKVMTKSEFENMFGGS